MSELLLINPRRRRRAASSTKRRRTTVKRRHNPVRALSVAPTRRRRRNPIGAKIRRLSRRRRNPISLRNTGIMGMLKDAALGGIGSVGVDAIMGQVRPMLPASLTSDFYAYSATKAAITVALGVFGKKAIGSKATAMATGALTVQIANVITGMLRGATSAVPSGSLGRGRMGYFPGASPSNNPTRQSMRLPMGANGSLSGVSARVREGVSVR